MSKTEIFEWPGITLSLHSRKLLQSKMIQFGPFKNRDCGHRGKVGTIFLEEASDRFLLTIRQVKLLLIIFVRAHKILINDNFYYMIPSYFGRLGYYAR